MSNRYGCNRLGRVFSRLSVTGYLLIVLSASNIFLSQVTAANHGLSDAVLEKSMAIINGRNCSLYLWKCLSTIFHWKSIGFSSFALSIETLLRKSSSGMIANAALRTSPKLTSFDSSGVTNKRASSFMTDNSDCLLIAYSEYASCAFSLSSPSNCLRLIKKASIKLSLRWR